jgi:hypothetical protein
MLPSTQETRGTEEKKEIAPPAPADGVTLKIAPATTIAITPSQRKSGQRLGMP